MYLLQHHVDLVLVLQLQHLGRLRSRYMRTTQQYMGEETMRGACKEGGERATRTYMLGVDGLGAVSAVAVAVVEWLSIGYEACGGGGCKCGSCQGRGQCVTRRRAFLN